MAQEKLIDYDTDSDDDDDDTLAREGSGNTTAMIDALNQPSTGDAKEDDDKTTIPDLVSTDEGGFLTNDDFTTWLKGFGCMFDSNWMHNNQEIFGWTSTMQIVWGETMLTRKPSDLALRLRGKGWNFINKKDIIGKPSE